MSLSLAARITVGAATATIAASGLVAAGVQSAHAAAASASYTCTAPGVFTSTFPVTVDLPVLPSSAPAGFPVPAGLLSFTSTVTIPADIATTLTSYGINGGKSDDFTTAFAATPVASPVVWDTSSKNPDGSVTFSGKGSNLAFVTPQSGTYAVTTAPAFTMTPTTNGAAFPVNVKCTTATPGALGSVKLDKQISATKAKAPKTIKKGAVAKLVVTVTNEFGKTGGAPVSGKVTAKDGKKKLGTVTLRNGKATIKAKNLSVGKHAIVVSYAGDGFSNKSKAKKLVITVTR
jgi:hypothetical protein